MPPAFPQILGFHVLDTRKRVSTPRMLLLSDVLFSERLARRRAHFSIPPSAFASQSQSLSGDGDPHIVKLSHSINGGYRVIYSFCHLVVHNLHSLPCLVMTGAALIGRRWADRQCRDCIVPVFFACALAPVQQLSKFHPIHKDAND